MRITFWAETFGPCEDILSLASFSDLAISSILRDEAGFSSCKAFVAEQASLTNHPTGHLAVQLSQSG